MGEVLTHVLANMLKMNELFDKQVNAQTLITRWSILVLKVGVPYM